MRKLEIIYRAETKVLNIFLVLVNNLIILKHAITTKNIYQPFVFK